VEIADLTTQLQEHESKARDLRLLVDSAPQVEAQYAQLARDYDVNKAQYAALLASYDKSKLGERADDAGSVRFQVVQPPTVSFRPVSPKRPALLAEVLVAALIFGAAVAYALDQMNPVLGSAVVVAQQTGLKVLAEVGPAFPTIATATWRRELRQVSIVLICLVAVLLIEVSLSRAGLRLDLPTLQHMVRSWA